MALDLDAISAEFLNQCGSCDAGVSVVCACADRDYRPTMLALVREVERLRAALAYRATELEEFADAQEHYADAASLRTFADRLRKEVNG